jgi:hypothetical protein
MLPRPEQQDASSQQRTMRRTGHVMISDSYQQRQSWKFSSLDDWNGKTFVDRRSASKYVTT